MTVDERIELLEEKIETLIETIKDMQKWIDRLESDMEFNRGSYID